MFHFVITLYKTKYFSTEFIDDWATENSDLQDDLSHDKSLI